MLYIKIKKVLLLSVVTFIVSSVLCAASSYAATTSLFSGLTSAGGKIFDGMQGVIYLVSGFGIFGVAIAGFFGKINYRWLSAIIIGLVVISLTGALLNYLVEKDTYGDKRSIIKSVINADGQ